MGIAAAPFLLLSAGAIAGATAYSLTKKPPSPIAKLSDGIEKKFKPIDFVSIVDDMAGSKMDLMRGVDGQIKLNITEPNRKPTIYASESRISEKTLGLIAINEAMNKLGNTIEQMENTSPFLIPQNQELINSYKTAVTKALDRGFDIKQQSIDSKLSKMGLSNSSNALNMQIGLAREKANSYANLALQESELAQNLKQQAIQNLNLRGNMLGAQANIGLNEQAQNIQMRGQEMQKELGYAQIAENRKQFAIQAGVNLMNSGNQNSLNARQLDNSALTNLNQANLASYSMQPANPFTQALGSIGGNLMGNAMGSLMNNIPGMGIQLKKKPSDINYSIPRLGV
jgi:hypothetical protein